MVPAFAGGTLGLLAGGLLKQRYEPAPTDDSKPAREASPEAGLDSESQTVVEIATNDDSEYEKALDLLEQLQSAAARQVRLGRPGCGDPGARRLRLQVREVALTAGGASSTIRPSNFRSFVEVPL